MIRPDVPIMNSTVTPTSRAEFAAMFEAAKVRRVWLAMDRCSLFERSDSILRLKENIEYFQSVGYEVGVWAQAYGFGDGLPRGMERDWARITSFGGVAAAGDAFCPEDDGFMQAYCEWMVDIAKAGARLIMLDDDLCLSVRPGLGCFCARHRALMEQTLGRAVDYKGIFVGGRNADRDAYLAVMGETHRSFCRKVRAAVDTVDPRIRVGYCAGYTSWDVEGTNPLELSKILAGETEPFFRFTGAPYWVERKRFGAQTLASVIECARLQAAWSRDCGAEYFAEADSYPRPCYNVPAVLMENFDLAMHASGLRSLKYLFDYTSSPRYERRYWQIHCRNLPFYEALENAFKESVPCGVQIHRPMGIVAEAALPDPMGVEKDVMTRSAFSMSAALLAAQGVPLCYEGASPFAAAFGEEARYLDLSHQKILLDLPAARFLQKQGADVGLGRITPIDPPTAELFGEERVRLARTAPNAAFYAVELAEGATVCSRFEQGAVASFTYGKFMVLNFDARAVGEGSELFRSYARGAQLRAFFENAYPAVADAPDLYCLCHRTETGFAVLFQNNSADPLFDFDVLLPAQCTDYRLTGASGQLQAGALRVAELHSGCSMLLELKVD